MKSRLIFLLEVRGGADHGATIRVGEAPCTIGRAKDCDLVLRDLGVSRRHLRAVATEDGVQLDASEGAAGFVIDGKALRSVKLRVGGQVLIGSTFLVIGAVGPPVLQRHDVGLTEVRTVLTGIGADAQAMASVYTLIEALDAARDTASLIEGLTSWSRSLHPPCLAALRREATPTTQVLECDAGGARVVTVPAPCDEPVALEFSSPDGSLEIADSLRRLLVVAGRLFGSSLSRVRRSEVADGEVASLRALSFGSSNHFLGASPAAIELAAKIPRLAGSDVSVLIDGETGVGKTFAARLIHESGPRAREPLRVINCAAIPEALLESELFGHERGAFTGAATQRIGALESAGRGTVFLDEIGELSLASQAKLLRAVEERRFERVGSNQTIDLKARLLCATNRDLGAMVAQGRFRSDLLFRLSVVRVTIPPLRERGEDTILLAEQVLRDAARGAPRRVEGFSRGAIDAMRSYSWPGNVRELRNAIDYAIVMGESPRIERRDLPEPLANGVVVQAEQAAPVAAGGVEQVTLPAPLAWLEERAIAAALRATKNNRKKAAALLGIPRSTLYSRIQTLPSEVEEQESEQGED